ncbi:DNA polymerase II large subunit [Methanococcus voltae]|uniref:DNA polymerase II large subunit n=1 Tax=Methanococcus voltae (strain ATCC BAA-1334 / A3) TaxID=456320 RepID=D7DVA3_METV3|nr:DNA polymerase II large subunit [Methanococcus voltae]MCS3901703.1 DNA polymerase II large subunit [Methanococcus voltae]
MLHVKTSEDMKDYFENILKDVMSTYDVAKSCRSKNLDVYNEIEIPLAKDMADRVEGIVGPAQVSQRIRDLVSELGKEPASLEIAKEIVEGNFGGFENAESPRDALAEQAVRTALAVITEGIVAAPLEGIAGVKIKKNFDGTEYLAIYFAGPIRSAGGTAQALAVLVGDYVRKNMGLDIYKPIDDEIERYVEEVELHQSEVGNFQYSPKPEEIRIAVKNISVEITGEATDPVDISGHRDLERVETNQIRGGALLALVEGVLLKAPKILRHVDKLKIQGWDWLKDLKSKKSSDEDSIEEENGDFELDMTGSEHADVKIDAITKYIGDVIAGRPVFAHPSTLGGFRLRYGRSRNTGFATDGFHPSTMYLSDEFMAIGTQLKTERPGKATCVVPVDGIDAPIVKLTSGSVFKVKSPDLAKKYNLDLKEVSEILFLGDILVNYGDFLENNHTILPSSWCIEWYEQILKSKNIGYNEFFKDFNDPTPSEAVKFAKETKTPLHPEFTYHWHDVSKEDILKLIYFLADGKLLSLEDITSSESNISEIFKNEQYEDFYDKNWNLEHFYVLKYDNTTEYQKYCKRLLELIGIPHLVYSENNIKNIIIFEYEPVLESLGFELTKSGDNFKLVNNNEYYLNNLAILEEFSKCTDFNSKKQIKELDSNINLSKILNSMHLINLLSKISIKRNCYVYVGARMGRPEKAASRKMKPPVNGLFPIGNSGGMVRLINNAIEDNANDDLDISVGTCPNCGFLSAYKKCPQCGAEVNLKRTQNVRLSLKDYWKIALANLSLNKCGDVKCIKGMSSKDKLIEPLEKAILRAINEVYVFKDGTTRFDCTDVPITHFKASEVHTSVEKLKELGYSHDIHGNELFDENQVLELKVQDVIVPKSCMEYFVNVSNFIDDLLEKYYGVGRFYNISTLGELAGQLIIGMAPHTSAGMVGRIVGYSIANVGYAHPYFHASKRRNCDGDEDAFFLLLDAFLNFSKKFLPDKRGGQMDAPLVLTTLLDPKEVDGEVHNMDTLWGYPLEFYEKSIDMPTPKEVKDLIETVDDRLGTEKQYEGLGYTHETTRVDSGPLICSYKTLGSMFEKTTAQLEVGKKIRATDERDVAEKVIQTHFVPDLIGNLRAFSRQGVRCKCGAKYRRMPLKGTCKKCNSKLILTVSKGAVEKYMDVSQSMAEKYEASDYIKQRLELIREGIDSLFVNERNKQFRIDDFFK